MEYRCVEPRVFIWFLVKTRKNSIMLYKRYKIL